METDLGGQGASLWETLHATLRRVAQMLKAIGTGQGRTCFSCKVATGAQNLQD